MFLKKSKELIQQILSNDIFKNLDTNLLLNKYAFKPNIILNSVKVQDSYVICKINPEGIIINKSGIYTFSNNIIWKPIADSIAITITASDVTIDMKNFYLKSINKKNYKTIGISANNVSNVKFLNNKILYVSYYGIQVISSIGVIITNTLIDGITYKNINIRSLSPCGIFISKSSKFSISDSKVKNINVTTDSTAAILLSECEEGTITNCKAEKIVNNDGASQGFSCILSKNIIYNLCKSIDLQSFFNGNILTTGHTVLGFCPIFCSNLLYTNCLATNLLGCCDDCHGISIFLNTDVTLSNFISKNIIDGITKRNSGAKATGIEVYGINCIIDSCYAKNIKAINPQDKQAAGFACSGFGNVFKNCRVKNVVVINENGKSCKKIGFGIGYGWAPDPRPEFRYLYAYNTLYSNCKAISCQVAFDTFNHINSTWNNITEKNSKKCILVQPGAVRILSCNPCSECNPEINFVAVNVALNNQYNNVKCSVKCKCN